MRRIPRRRITVFLAPVGLLAALLAALLAGTSCTLDLSYDKYAIVFGVGDYSDPAVSDLTWTLIDARDMAALLAAQGYEVLGWDAGGLATGETLDSYATEANFRSILEAVAAQASKDGLFLFYFSGHGGQTSGNRSEGHAAADTDEEFIAFHAAPYPPDAAAADIVTDDELADALSILPCLKKIVIIDACNSGGLIGDSADVDGVPPDYSGTIYLALGKLGSALSAYFSPRADGGDINPGDALVVAGAGEREPAQEDLSNGYWGFEHGFFTYFLLQVPARGDGNADGFVTVTEAYDYVREQLDSNWNANVSASMRFAPHVAGGPIDYVLFAAP